MEKKKIAKLVLKKETISNLSNNTQGVIIGGYDAYTEGAICNPIITTEGFGYCLNDTLKIQ